MGKILSGTRSYSAALTRAGLSGFVSPRISCSRGGGPEIAPLVRIARCHNSPNKPSVTDSLRLEYAATISGKVTIDFRNRRMRWRKWFGSLYILSHEWIQIVQTPNGT